MSTLATLSSMNIGLQVDSKWLSRGTSAAFKRTSDDHIDVIRLLVQRLSSGKYVHVSRTDEYELC